MVYVLATADACGDYALANLLYILQTAFDIICIIVPIILIISLVMTVFSLVTNPDQKDATKKIFTKVAAALIVFFLPTVVNLVMSWLPDGGLDITSCWQAARERNEQISTTVTPE